MKQDCKIWKGRKNTKGYGIIRELGEVLVHRWIYEAINGEIPEGMYVCHHCDTRDCYNPNHLFLGTPQDNTNDMISKNRNPLGKKLPQTKLSDDDVRQIFQYRFEGKEIREIAKLYHVTKHTVWEILTFRKREYAKNWFSEDFLEKIKNIPVDHTDQIGSKAHQAKLYEKQVIEIREKYKCGKTMLQLAREYNVSDGTIYDICKRRTWKHIE